MVQVNLNPTDLYDNAKESGFLDFHTINQKEKHWIRGKSGIENNRETLKVNKMAAGNTFKGVSNQLVNRKNTRISMIWHSRTAYMSKKWHSNAYTEIT